jgi:hypothetical protein
MAMSEEAKAAKREYMRKYREKNRERMNETHRAWRKSNRHKIEEYNERFWNKKAKEMQVDE